MVTVFLFTPNDQSFSDAMKFEIEAPPEAPTAGEARRSDVQVPLPVPIEKNQWEDLGWTEDSVAEVREDPVRPQILVNMDNHHLVKLLQSGGYQEAGVKRMRNSFLLYVAFYAWGQHIFCKAPDLGISGEDLEKYVSGELDRAAQTVVHAISAGSRLADEE
jgi:hypothetical protein